MSGLVQVSCILVGLLFCQCICSSPLDVVRQRTVSELLATTFVNDSAIKYNYFLIFFLNLSLIDIAAAGYLPSQVLETGQVTTFFRVNIFILLL